MGARLWFVDSQWQLVDWASAVTGGRAVLDVFEVADPDGPQPPVVTLWAGKGQQVGAGQVTQAQAAASKDPLPARRPFPAPLPGVPLQVRSLTRAEWDALSPAQREVPGVLWAVRRSP